MIGYTDSEQAFLTSPHIPLNSIGSCLSQSSDAADQLNIAALKWLAGQIQ